MARPLGSKNSLGKGIQQVMEQQVPQTTTPRKDIMKPQEIDYSKEVTSEGGMAQSLNKKKEDMWGGKIPPLPRSELAKKPRGGLALQVKN